MEFDSFPPQNDRANTMNAKNHKFLRKTRIYMYLCVRTSLVREIFGTTYASTEVAGINF